MSTSIDFAPHLPVFLIAIAISMAAILVVASFVLRARGAWARLLVFAALIFVIANPLIVHEARTPLSDVAAIVIDRSQSMSIENRQAQEDAALASLRKQLSSDKSLEVREVVVTTTTTGEDNGTELFAALNAALADVPPERVAGAILITDGEVHDAPPANKLTIKAPIQVLLAGRRDERDRKLTIVNAARFAIVGQNAHMTVRVEDLGAVTNSGTAEIDLRIDGTSLGSQIVPLGHDAGIDIPIKHGGENVVEIEARPGPSELTLQNNRAVVTVSGVRDRLRVLLVSGEPHAGERVWRNLLKADPSVDLIHFTILRPPAKQDATPLEELSLIAFPTRELFSEKLSSFDLVIFDRYSERGILPLLYYENLANYVDNGGALLVASGPEFAQSMSISHTPLAAVLPAQPTGDIVNQGFKPIVTPEGLAHPVTADLPGANTTTAPPSWGRWFRLIGATKVSGETVLSGPDNRPLLVLDSVQKGRVAELLSDQAWLWARGFEGGGPQAELLRRLAHWLMKEPELEEERLSATIEQGTIRVERRTMAKSAKPVTITFPSGMKFVLNLKQIEPGIWRGALKATELGLYRLADGTLNAVAAAGPLNPKEVSDMRATETILAPLANATGGSIHWLVDGTPSIRRVSTTAGASGANWIGLRANETYRVTNVEQEPLLPQWLSLLLLLGTLLLAWWVEGR